jgi:protein-L-isoaspartate(D-aspartate) O-methyltransferase
LQAFPVDSKKIAALDVSLRVKGDNILPGQNNQQLPMLVVVFYDEKQTMIGERGIGPWRGTFGWQTENTSLRVPPRATHAIMRVGLFGATGELSIDALQMKAHAE